MATVNRQIKLAARPVGLPKVSDFNLVFAPLPSPGEGEVLTQSMYLSFDPSMRVRMNEDGPSTRSIALGAVLPGAAVAQVMESKNSEFSPGDIVEGPLGWQEYAVDSGRGLRRVDPDVNPVSLALGVLGTPGLTAYFGILDVCSPSPGETVVVSGAAESVGMVAGQIAKLQGCRVVGVAGSDAKVSWLLEELGFDAALNHKGTENGHDELKRLCPAGVDVYFDNVGGVITDAVLRLINVHARIAVCGQLSQYNLEEPEHGPRCWGQLIEKQAKVQGFVVSAFAERFPAALKQLNLWLQRGELKYREEVSLGIESAPQAFIGMLQGKNQGKQLVRLSEH